MSGFEQSSKAYETVASAIRYIRSRAREQPTLDALAHHLGLSPGHLQRLFSEWAGISPKRFLQYLTKEHAKQALRASSDVLSTTFETGLSSPGRLHDLLVGCDAVSPGDVRTGGRGLTIRFGFAPTPFGTALVGSTERGVCHLRFMDAQDSKEALAQLRVEWPQAQTVEDEPKIRHVIDVVFGSARPAVPLHLMLRGTNFQIKVWEALMRVPNGVLVSYRQLAESVGVPKGARAVAGAVAANRVAVLIPCHRVIRESGELSRYRWGEERKAALIAWEAHGGSP